MNEDLFDTTIFFDHKYECKDDKKFKKLIYDIESGAGPEILNIYINSNGTLDDICFMRRYGNGEYNVAWIGKSIINGNNLDTFKRLIELDKLQINSRDNEYCLLSYAILNNHDMANYLLNLSPNPNMPGHRGKTPLYYAILKADLDIIIKLINLGANPNLTYGMSKTNYLYFAVYRLDLIKDSNTESILLEKNILIKIIKLLINSGAEIQEDVFNKYLLNIINNIIIDDSY
jgi:ankyrin repeat protein